MVGDHNGMLRLREHAPVLGHTADFHGGTTAWLAMRL